MTATHSSSRPPRQQHRLRNDEVILDAAVPLAAQQGWAGLTPGHVASAAGLSRPTVLQRHASRADLASALWLDRLWRPLSAALVPLIGAVDAADSEAILSALDVFVTPTVKLRAAVELLLVSSYVSVLSAVVGSTFGPWFAPLTTDAPEALGARRALAVGSAFGFVMGSTGPGPGATCAGPERESWATGLAAAGQPVAAWPDRFEVSPAAGPDTGDRTRDRVLGATVDSVAERGYEAATIEVIAARCGFTRAVIFQRYPTKYDLFLDASERTYGPVISALDAQRRQLEPVQGLGASEAWFTRELMSPDLKGLRTVLLEEIRLAGHEPGLSTVAHRANRPGQLTAVMCAEHDTRRNPGRLSMVITSGMLLVAQLNPKTWALPLGVALTPWRRAQAGCGLS